LRQRNKTEKMGNRTNVYIDNHVKVNSGGFIAC